MRSLSRPRRAPHWPALALLALLGGCEDDRPAPAAPEPAAARREPGVQPSVEPPPSPWPTEVRTLEASVADFESLERCVASMRASVPVEVSELFDDLGYDGALGEICRSLQAAATGDPSHCDALVSSTVERRCRVRVATLHNKPEACPDATGHDGGRDPTCLAWASRDASLCDGAPVGGRSTCLAVATGEPERCEDPLGLRSAASCRAMVARLDSVVDADPPGERPPAELAIDGAEPAVALPADAPRALERGVVATADGCARRVELSVTAPLSEARDHVGLTLELRFEGDGATLGSRSELAIGPVGTGYALRGELELGADTERRLGGALEASFHGTYLRDGQERTVDGHLRTFFRDWAPLPEHCAAQ